MRHLTVAIEFVLLLTGFCAAMWIMLGFAVHARKRLIVMLDMHYYWKDAGVLLRRMERQKTGPAPGRHRAIQPERQPQLELVEAKYVPEDDPGNFYYKPAHELPADGQQHTVVLGDPLTVPEQSWPPPSPVRAIDDPANTVVLRVGDRHG